MQRIADLVDSGALGVVEDVEALARFVRWVTNWDADEKSNLIDLMAYLKAKHPAPGLWDVVRFE